MHLGGKTPPPMMLQEKRKDMKKKSEDMVIAALKRKEEEFIKNMKERIAAPLEEDIKKIVDALGLDEEEDYFMVQTMRTLLMMSVTGIMGNPGAMLGITMNPASIGADACATVAAMFLLKEKEVDIVAITESITTFFSDALGLNLINRGSKEEAEKIFNALSDEDGATIN
jgi:hypothetical protein